MNNEHKERQNVIEPPFFSNWADLFMPNIANAVLPFALKVNWLTPNFITLFSFSLAENGLQFDVIAEIEEKTGGKPEIDINDFMRVYIRAIGQAHGEHIDFQHVQDLVKIVSQRGGQASCSRYLPIEAVPYISHR